MTCTCALTFPRTFSHILVVHSNTPSYHTPDPPLLQALTTLVASPPVGVYNTPSKPTPANSPNPL